MTASEELTFLPAPTEDEWQQQCDDLRRKLAPIADEIWRIVEQIFSDAALRMKQRQRLTAAKHRARIVTRAKGIPKRHYATV